MEPDNSYLYSDCPDMPEEVCVNCPLWDGLQCLGEGGEDDYQDED